MYIFLSQNWYSLESKETDADTHFSDHFHFVCDKFKIPNGTLCCLHRELILLRTWNVQPSGIGRKLCLNMLTCPRIWNILEIRENLILSVSTWYELCFIRNWNSVSIRFTYIVPLLGKEICVVNMWTELLRTDRTDLIYFKL